MGLQGVPRSCRELEGETYVDGEGFQGVSKGFQESFSRTPEDFQGVTRRFKKFLLEN